MKQVLQQCGLDRDVRVASDGQQALQYLAALGEDASSPALSLVLLDLNLPKVPGIDVLRHLRAGPCSRTPVIIVTSSILEADRIAVGKIGVEAYFQKPNDLGAYMELANVIKRILIEHLRE